jgi:hypothetical protein
MGDVAVRETGESLLGGRDVANKQCSYISGAVI